MESKKINYAGVKILEWEKAVNFSQKLKIRKNEVLMRSSIT